MPWLKINDVMKGTRVATRNRSLTRYSGHLIWAMIRLGGVRYACTEVAGVPASCP